MKKITNREYKMAGAFTLVVGTFLLAVSLGFPGTPNPRTPKPLALIGLSAMPVLFGLLSLLTKPIRSFGRPSIKSAATPFKAVRRSGLRSRANILDDTSMAITISIPFVVFVRVEISSV